MALLDYIFQSLPTITALVIFAIRLEIKIARLDTNQQWIIKELNACQPNSDHPTP